METNVAVRSKRNGLGCGAWKYLMSWAPHSRIVSGLVCLVFVFPYTTLFQFGLALGGWLVSTGLLGTLRPPPKRPLRGRGIFFAGVLGLKTGSMMFLNLFR